MLLVLTSVLLFSINSFSQEMEDIVYLKNGSVIRGTIIEQIPNESIKIKTREDNIFVYKIEEILKISKEETSSQNKEKSKTKYIGTFSVGASIPKSDKEFSKYHGLGFNLNATSGILISNNVGLRLDVRYSSFPGKGTYYWFGTPSTVSSLNINFESIIGDFNKNSMVKPYGIFGIGADYVSQSSQGKVYLGFDVGIGVAIEIAKKNGISLSLESKYHGNNNEGYAKGFVPINIGITIIN
jgi:hypothetical protein